MVDIFRSIDSPLLDIGVFGRGRWQVVVCRKGSEEEERVGRTLDRLSRTWPGYATEDDQDQNGGATVVPLADS